jgi:hypothetical protein
VKVNNEEKEPFIMYNTVSFLFDESLPNLELISQQVMLDESNIARRLTESQAINDKIHL